MKISDGTPKNKASFSRMVISSVVGQSLEWYDFYIYGALAPVLTTVFFPQENQFIGLISSLSVFAVGFLMRPLGGLVFGYQSDKLGRKAIFVMTLLTMAIATALVGLLPSYSQIGLLAPFLLVFLRLIQGFSLGGESMGSVIYLLEHAPRRKQNFISSWLSVAVMAGWLLASLVTSLIAYILTKEEFYSWGWRIPFLFGLFTGAIGLILRLKGRETPIFEDLIKKGDIAKNPLKEMWKTSKLHSFAIMGIVSSVTLSLYIILVYLPLYFNTVGGVPLKTALLMSTLTSIISLFVIPSLGLLADHIGHRYILLTAAGGFVIFSPLIFYWGSFGDIKLCLLALFIGSLFLNMYASSFYALAAGWFPSHIRGTSSSVSYNFMVAAIGGTAPLVATILTHVSGTMLAPGFYLSAWSLVTFLILFFYRGDSTVN